MALIGYARVSSVGQSLEVQRDRLLNAGVEPDHLFEEKKSGLDKERPKLKEAMRFARKGDTFLVSRIDRLARSTSDLYRIVGDLQDRGVSFKCLDQTEIDTTSKYGKLMFGILASIAEFETDLRKERQMDGIAGAKSKGVKFGRKVQLTPSVLATVQKMRADGALIREIMEATTLSKASVYRALAYTDNRSK
ncbi:recombinase family protein [Agrobacterium sp. FDAARGOS_525]|uniref:recombinase family protein n=1 Tax=Agrobacterium sp. FDAARGOS_525 TaxID=2420311 RepID=UPI000F66EC76|nr:recombinase family protein [Agrobacterium sp. FDAARGOS_525]RSC31477.1 recombinase family protein [Agrobacterium sp. FDAARGOS_525]